MNWRSRGAGMHRMSSPLVYPSVTLNRANELLRVYGVFFERHTIKLQIRYLQHYRPFLATSDTPRSALPHRPASTPLSTRIISHHPLLDTAAAPQVARGTLFLVLRDSSPVQPRSCIGRFFVPIRVC